MRYVTTSPTPWVRYIVQIRHSNNTPIPVHILADDVNIEILIKAVDRLECESRSYRSVNAAKAPRIHEQCKDGIVPILVLSDQQLDGGAKDVKKT